MNSNDLFLLQLLLVSCFFFSLGFIYLRYYFKNWNELQKKGMLITHLLPILSVLVVAVTGIVIVFSLIFSFWQP